VVERRPGAGDERQREDRRERVRDGEPDEGRSAQEVGADGEQAARGAVGERAPNSGPSAIAGRKSASSTRLIAHGERKRS
jgi:hypothetical protein